MKKASSSDYPITLDDNSLSDICHQLSHDIGNPLTAIISYSSILEQAEQYTLPLDKVSSYSKNISKETWRISRLMEKFLLLISKKVVISPFTAGELMKRIEARYRTRYELHTLQIEFDGFDIEAEIPADIDQCCIIICEIANNAVAAQEHLDYSLQNLHLRFTDEHEGYFVIEATNPSPCHSKSLQNLLQPEEKEYTGQKDSLGIGLSAISSTMHRWRGHVEIEEIMDNTSEINRALFTTRLFFPKDTVNK